MGPNHMFDYFRWQGVPTYPLTQSDKPRTAVFWDAENVSEITGADVVENFNTWLENDYDINAKFAFADWSGPYREVANALNRIGFDFIHVPDDLKDSTDYQMAAYMIDWLLRSPETSSYVIVSGDAGFALIMRALQKQGKKVTVVSNPVVTRPEYMIYADRYEDIDRFKPKALRIDPLKDEKGKKLTPDELKEVAVLRLLETIARLEGENRPTYDKYVKVMLSRYNPDISFGRPGSYNWEEAITESLFDGLIVHEGQGVTAQLKLTKKGAEMSEGRSASVESALEKLGEIVETMYEKGQHTGMESVVHEVRKAKIDYVDFGFQKFGDFSRAAEGRNIIRIETKESSTPIIKPVYSEERARIWYETNLENYFGKGARIPQSRFVQRTIQFLYQYDAGFSKLESYLSDEKTQKSYDAILENSGVSFIPPYEKVLLTLLLGLGIDCQEALEIVNRELAPLGYELKCPE
ncbi:MAG: NYN domain-containing protein [Candidatus Thorarchaeota archaeon]|nr:NYN domain-containing protein [Candidatus Thorarchaeota archaeon]